MPYCIYLRKSRADAEAELRGEGETLARHEKALTAFAQQAGLDVTEIYKEIISGETIAARPMMQRLLAEVSEGMWDGVVVMDVDRLARGNSIDQGIISQTFLYAQTKIITPTKTYDPTNEFDEEYFEFGLFMSRREYKMINRRLQRGRIASAKEGKYVGNKSPYGYERVKLEGEKGFKLSIVPQQADVIRNIFEWYTTGIVQANGTRKRIGTALIARELNERKIPPPKDDVWTASTIRDMLINPVYIGKIRWNWRPAKKKMHNGKIVLERGRNYEALIYDGLHEPIVSEFMFEAAAAVMAKNKRRPIRGDKIIQNPLAGLVICQKCGRKMQRKSDSKLPDMIMCAAPTCDNHGAYLFLIEKVVIEMLRKWTEGYLLSTVCSTPSAPEDFKSELSSLLSSESKLNAQLNKAYEAFETDIYDAATFKKRSEAIKQSLKEIEAKKKDLQTRADKAKENERIFNEFIPKVRQIIEAYDSITDVANKNRLLSEVIDHIDYIKETRGHGHEQDFSVSVYPKLPDV